MKSFCDQAIKSERLISDSTRPDKLQYALRRGAGFWELIFEGRQAVFKHVQGALYVACLLLDPPREPLHAVALAVKARGMANGMAGAADLVQQRNLGLDDAEAMRNLRRRGRALEAVLENELESEPAKAEARRELGEIDEYLRRNPWRSADAAQKCVRAVTRAIHRLHRHLERAIGAQGEPHPVLRGFARHLHQHLLIPSGRGSVGGARRLGVAAGCFVYEPPAGVVWTRGEGLSLK